MVFFIGGRGIGVGEEGMARWRKSLSPEAGRYWLYKRVDVLFDRKIPWVTLVWVGRDGSCEIMGRLGYN